MTAFSHASRGSQAIVLAGFFALIAQIALSFPGIMTWDSFDQYAQAIKGQYNDWHPPIMAIVMRALLPVGEGGAGIFVLHLALLWFGLIWIALALRDAGHGRTSWAMLAIGVVPAIWLPALFVHKDVGMVAAFVAAFAVLFHRRMRGGTPRAVEIAACAAALTYGTLIRSNAVFAVPALVAYFVAPRSATAPIRLLLCYLLLVPGLLVAQSKVNHRLLGASWTDVKRSLLVFDTVGIAYFARSAAVMPGTPPPPLATIDRCYTARLWDGLDKGACGPLLQTRTQDGLTWSARRLAATIAAHPLAYAEHRISHANYEFRGLMPPAPPQDWVLPADRPSVAQPALRPVFEQALDLVANNPLFSPLAWYVTAAAVLAAMASHPSAVAASRLADAAFAILLSGASYTGGLVLVGVADLYRYQHYGMTAALIGIVLFAASATVGQPWQRRTLSAAMVIFATMIGVVWISRIAP